MRRKGIKKFNVSETGYYIHDYLLWRNANELDWKKAKISPELTQAMNGGRGLANGEFRCVAKTDTMNETQMAFIYHRDHQDFLFWVTLY